MNKIISFVVQAFIAVNLSVSPLPLAFAQDRGVQLKPGDSLPGLPEGYYSNLHSLCIGINDYKSASIPDLSYAEADAEAIAQMLREKFGFHDTRTLLGENATRQGITAAVAEFFKANRVSANDAVLIYYSGHGQTVDLPNGGEMGFLIPQDAEIQLDGPPDIAGYYQSCIPMQDIKTWRTLIPARHILFMADACYSGLLASDRSIPAPVLDALKLSVCQILTAGTRNQKAREEAHLGHGLFTAKILEALSSGVADLNKDGYIRASELGQFMRDINLENQTPQSRIMDGEGDFILVSQKRAEGDLSGVVIDQADKKPLAGAEVTLAGTEAGDRTNRKGEFKFKAPVGGYAGFSIRLPRLPKPVEVGMAVSVEAGEEEYVELAVPLPADYSTAENVTEEGWLEEEDPHGRKVRVWDSAETPPKRQNGCIWRYPLADSGETCDLVWIEPGKFQMGSPESEDGHQEDEQQHEVTLTRGFWMGRYEITNKQFGAFIDATDYKTTAEEAGKGFAWNGLKWLVFEGLYWREPVVAGSPYLGEDYPVIQVSWKDCQAFLDWAGLAFPTEAQWEYACRAGTTARCYWGDDPGFEQTCEYANVADSSMEALFEVKGSGFDCTDEYASVSPVGSLKSNAWGLYDMSGNAGEWCLDEYGENYFSVSPAKDPVNRNGDHIKYTFEEETFEGENRVIKGGNWGSLSFRIRSASRDRLNPLDRGTTTGFRAVHR